MTWCVLFGFLLLSWTVFSVMAESVNVSKFGFHFRTVVTSLNGVLAHKYLFFKDDTPQTFSLFLSLLSDSESLIHTIFYETIRNFPAEALYWECPPTSFDTFRDQPFEFVLIESRALASRIVDIEPFSDHFKGSLDGSSVVSFLSLGKDAQLVVPVPLESPSIQLYTHLASFMKLGNPAQISSLWINVASVVMQSLGHLEHVDRFRPLWLSTSGLGVSWLHVRLDSVPKYYHWSEYKHMRLSALH